MALIEKICSMDIKDFTLYVESLNLKLNLKNDTILKKIKETFLEIKNKNNKITRKEVINLIKNNIGIKYSAKYRKGLEERGFNEDEIDEFMSRFASKSKRAEKRREKIKNITTNKYRFKSNHFLLDKRPKCKLCGSEIIFGCGQNNELIIYGCSNKDCESNFSIKKAYQAFLPENAIEEIKEKKRNASVLNVNFWIKNGFTEEEAKEKIFKIQSERSKKVKNRCGANRERLEKKYGVEYTDNLFKKRSRYCIEYWLSRGYDREFAVNKIKELQEKNYKKRKEDEKRNPLKYKLCNNKNVLYWINMGYSEDDAKKIISKMQKTFTLKKCIEKYGKDAGYKRWKERQIKWQESLNKAGFHQLGHSKISQELFNEIIKKYSINDTDYIFYETKNKEYTLKNDNGFFYRYDFCDLKRRKFIEFNGDIYHANPKIYKEYDKPNPFHNLTSKELWEIDADKKSIAERNGFEELIVWEKDYRENKEKIINECLNFLFRDEK